MHFFVKDETKNIFKPGDLELMVKAINTYSKLFLEFWPLAPIWCELYTSSNLILPSDVVVTWKNKDDGDTGSYGYHSETKGQAYSVLFTDDALSQGAGVLDGGKGGMSLLSVLCHEVFESAVDWFCADWVLMPSGLFLAKEPADPVQMDLVPFSMDGKLVHLSNTVTSAYFDADAPYDAQFDLLGVVKAPFECRKGGYQMVYDPSKIHDKDGPIANLWGSEIPEWIKRKNEFKSARAMKRRDRERKKEK